MACALAIAACEADEPANETSFTGIVLWADDRSRVVDGRIQVVPVKRNNIGTPNSTVDSSRFAALDEFSEFSLTIDANPEIDFFQLGLAIDPNTDSVFVAQPQNMNCPQCKRLSPGIDHRFELLVPR